MVHEETVKYFFAETIFGEVCEAIELLIAKKLKFAPALCLVSYTETMGGMRTGNLQDRNKMRPNFVAFLPYLGQTYVELQNKIDLYDRLRHGLVHQGFPKGEFAIFDSFEHFVDAPIGQLPGVVFGRVARFGSENILNFSVKEYYRDFRAGVEKYYKELLDGNHPDLVKKFLYGISTAKDREKLRSDA